MEFKKTTREEVPFVLKIIEQAQQYLKSRGIDQWQNGYPNDEVILHDIDRGESYVLANNDKIIGTAAISFSGEETYDVIYEGEWITNKRYVVIHRIAVDNSFKGTGVGTEIINNVEKLAKSENIFSIRIDTHEENFSMQSLLNKNGFKNCGYILLKDGSKRIAFEKELI